MPLSITANRPNACHATDVSDRSTDPRWGLLQAARPALVEALSNHGVVRIEYVAAFPHFEHFSVWLGTKTDAERDLLGTTNPLHREVRNVLAEVGFTDEQLRELLTTAQSQQTVDRDYAGSWFYALR